MKIIKCLCGVIYGIFFVSYNIIVDANLTKRSENIAKPTTATLNSFQYSGGGFARVPLKEDNMSEELIELINLLLYGYITPEIYDREYKKLVIKGKA